MASRRTGIALAILGFTGSLGAQAFPACYGWDHERDWTERPAIDHGTTNGNPDDDLLGYPVWRAMTIDGGDVLGSSTPWFLEPRQCMTWDADWFRNGGRWSTGDDFGASLGPQEMTHTSVPVAFAPHTPLLEFQNVFARAIDLLIEGSCTLSWTFSGVTPTQRPVDVVLVRFDASGGGHEVVFGNTYSPNLSEIPIERSFTMELRVHLEPGESLALSFRSRIQGGAGSTIWNGLRTALRYDVAPYCATWSDRGMGLIGTLGVPRLVLGSPLIEGRTVTLALLAANPGSITALFVGANSWNLPFFHGTLVPTPDAILTLAPDALGNAWFAAPWPPLAAGQNVYLHAWTVDPLAPEGLSASNAIEVRGR